MIIYKLWLVMIALVLIIGFILIIRFSMVEKPSAMFISGILLIFFVCYTTSNNVPYKIKIGRIELYDYDIQKDYQKVESLTKKLESDNEYDKLITKHKIDKYNKKISIKTNFRNKLYEKYVGDSVNENE